MDTVRGWPGPQSYRGRDGFVEFWSTWTEDFEGWSVELERLVDGSNEQVVALFHQTATGRGSGTPVEAPFRPGLRAGRWPGDSDAELHGPGRSPRSRRAVGVALWTKSSTRPRDTAWAMSEENVEVVRAVVRGVFSETSKDTGGVAEFWDPDGDYYPVRELPGGATMPRPPGDAAFLSEYLAAWRAPSIHRRGRHRGRHDRVLHGHIDAAGTDERCRSRPHPSLLCSGMAVHRPRTI